MFFIKMINDIYHINGRLTTLKGYPQSNYLFFLSAIFGSDHLHFIQLPIPCIRRSI